jgi:hypothetical protein
MQWPKQSARRYERHKRHRRKPRATCEPAVPFCTDHLDATVKSLEDAAKWISEYRKEVLADDRRFILVSKTEPKPNVTFARKRLSLAMSLSVVAVTIRRAPSAWATMESVRTVSWKNETRTGP